MTVSPRLTVVLPAYNAEPTIAAAIQSVLHQSYTDFELWVLTSASSDRTVEIAKGFTDPRVKVFELGSMGFQDTLAYALENAQTEWLARMDADDLSFPERFEEQMALVAQRPDLVLVGTQRAYLTPFGHIFEPGEAVFSKEVNRLSLRSRGNDRKFFVDASVIFRRSVALDVGGYDQEFEMGDIPLWFRMLEHGMGWEIAKPLYLYRLQPSSLLHTQIQPSNQSYRVLAKYAPDQLHLYPEETAHRSKSEERYRQKLWLRIAEMELLAGNIRAALQAVAFLEKDGPFAIRARQIRRLTYFGRLGLYYNKMRKRHPYRHRSDWEDLFTTLVGSLALDQSVYSQ